MSSIWRARRQGKLSNTMEHEGETLYSTAPLQCVQVKGEDRLLIVTCHYSMERGRKGAFPDFKVIPESVAFHLLESDAGIKSVSAEVFFDPFFRLVDASRNDEARDAVIGYDTLGQMLFVVHIEVEDESIRIISARKATLQERNDYDS
jgi:uncharacterized DUF497 family protein